MRKGHTGRDLAAAALAAEVRSAGELGVAGIARGVRHCWEGGRRLSGGSRVNEIGAFFKLPPQKISPRLSIC